MYVVIRHIKDQIWSILHPKCHHDMVIDSPTGTTRVVKFYSISNPHMPVFIYCRRTARMYQW